ncbi:MAG: DUF4214 domain-containing protein [Pyrinomonadaceae bacterium]
MIVNGDGFVDSTILSKKSVVRWFDPDTGSRSDLVTTFNSSKQLTAAVPLSKLNAANAIEITVFNSGPGGGTSNAQVFFINATAAAIVNTTSNVADPISGTATASATSTTGGSLTAAAGSIAGQGSGSLTVAQYTGDPVGTNAAGGTPTFSNANGGFFDAHVSSDSNFNTLTLNYCNSGGTALYWWNGFAWNLVSNQSYSPTTGCISVTVNTTSSPSIADLTGTVFGIATGPAVGEITSDAAAPLPLGKSSINISANFTDESGTGPYTADIYWGDSNTPVPGTVNGNTVTGSHTYTAAGTYSVKVVVTRASGGAFGSSSKQDFVVVLSPSAGDAASTVQFEAANYSIAEDGGSIRVTVKGSGNTKGEATVDYTTGGTASMRSDYIAASGTLRFAAGETTKSFNVLITDNGYVDDNRTVTLTLLNPTGAAFGERNTATLTIINDDAAQSSSNPVDDAQFFVRQQYMDFLNRLPEDGGLEYWTNEITKCGTNADCINARRRDVSAAFFIEQEFQQTAYFTYLVRKSTLGAAPTYMQYTFDRNGIGFGSDQEKVAFTEAWVKSADFTRLYPAQMSGADFINTLLDSVKRKSGVDLSTQRGALLADFNANNNRARIVRQIAESSALQQAEYNRAFVLTEYFGYLRRDPDAGGYQFWLDVLDNRVPNNYRSMVCAFITSAEYQDRFSSLRSRTDAICGGIAP